MSVTKEWGLCCPKCGEDDKLNIAATIYVRLTPDGTDADELGGSHEWDTDSEVVCDHQGRVKDFNAGAA